MVAGVNENSPIKPDMDDPTNTANKKSHKAEIDKNQLQVSFFFSFRQIERSRGGNIGRKIDLRWRRRDTDFQRCCQRVHKDLFYR